MIVVTLASPVMIRDRLITHVELLPGALPVPASGASSAGVDARAVREVLAARIGFDPADIERLAPFDIALLLHLAIAPAPLVPALLLDPVPDQRQRKGRR